MSNIVNSDPELQNFYTTVKEGIKTDHQKYIKEHPEIRQLVNDYFSALLLHKPDNVYDFSKKYFAFFNKQKEGEELPPLVVIGPSEGDRVEFSQ